MPEIELSPEAQHTLAALPFLVGMSVALAGKNNFIQFLKEMRVVEHIPDFVEEFGDNPLIRASLAERDYYTITVTPQLVIIKERGDETKHRYKPDQLLEHTLTLCHAACTILTNYSDPAAAAGYRQWVRKVAHKVADAAFEIGVFGWGKKREEETESAVIVAIETALG